MDLTISTNKLEQSKEFYMEHLGFQLVFENDWYIEFTGKGMILSFEVADVDAEYERMKAAEVRICEELKDKPWGERSFVINDPNGVHLYIYKAIPPTPDYQEIYNSFKK